MFLPFQLILALCVACPWYLVQIVACFVCHSRVHGVYEIHFPFDRLVGHYCPHCSHAADRMNRADDYFPNIYRLATARHFCYHLLMIYFHRDSCFDYGFSLVAGFCLDFCVYRIESWIGSFACDFVYLSNRTDFYPLSYFDSSISFFPPPSNTFKNNCCCYLLRCQITIYSY